MRVRASLGVYRSPTPAVAARVGELRVDIAEHEARLTPTFWSALPNSVAERLEELGRAAAGRVSPSEDAGVLAAVASYRDALLDAIAMVPALEAEARLVPDHAPELDENALDFGRRSRRADHHRDFATLLDSIGRIVKRSDPRAAVKPLANLKLSARFRAQSMPLSLLAGLRSSRKGFGPEFDLLLATSVPRGAPRLRLQPETWSDSMLNALELYRSRETDKSDDNGWGGVFTIQAEHDAGTRLLNQTVRSALLEVARSDVPTLTVADGVAALRWSFEPDPGFDAAVRALAAIRAAKVTVELLRDSRRDSRP